MAATLSGMRAQVLFFAAIAGFAYAGYSARGGGGMNAAEAPAQTHPASPWGNGAKPSAHADDDALVLARGSGGQFHLTAQVDGQDAEFLVDTGADMVALTVASAEELGFGIDRSAFVPMGETASGTGYGTMVRIGTLEVAGQDFHDVDAVVMDGLGVNLLGQSVLGQLGQVSLQGDEMILRR